MKRTFSGRARAVERALRSTLVGALFVMLSALGCSTPNLPSPVSTRPALAVGSMVPDFAALDIDGVPFRLSKHLGKDVVLINFFATWCAPCLSEMPHLRTIYEKNQVKGLTLVVISLDGAHSIADLRAFWRRHELTFPAILDEDLRIAATFNPTKAVPLSWLVDRSGRVVMRLDGYRPGDGDVLAKDVATLLDGPEAR